MDYSSEHEPILERNYVSFWEKLSNPKYAPHRYIVLVVLCLINLGNYYIYDNPAALETEITRDLVISTSQYTTLYSLYSWPNVILGLFGGYLLDKVIGLRIGTIIFSLFVCFGQLVFALGAFLNTFWVMQLGRFIFGLGGENLSVAVNAYAVSWYKGSELNMAFGLMMSISRLGSTVNFKTMVHIYNFFEKYYTGYKCLGLTLLFAVSFCIFSLIMGLLMAYFDKRAERILKKEPPKAGEEMKFQDVFHFGLDFWMVSFICVLYYITIFPFIGLGTVFFLRKYGVSEDSADSINSSVYTISAIVSPILGILIDKVGRCISFVFAGTAVTLLGHGLLAFSFVNPWVGIVCLGFGYSTIACALWPLIPDIVPEFRLGTAYGVVQCVQNLGLALANMAAGHIVDSRGFLALQCFFIISLVVCLILIIFLFLSNFNKGGILNISAKKRAAMTEAKRIAEEQNLRREEIEGYSAEPPALAGQDESVRRRYLSKIGTQDPSNLEEARAIREQISGPSN
ncbi:major facilitator superfamily domain-containing protein 1 isoform X1 [Tetranychus urticae]|uniref:Lysosomal dipeptide transporter MFSD1 n=1 Tax=Tetranychus urticae TaxID=32264 RepID=T1KB07_TETUR|nr:major facilitator superfamily domain-containing protein 1 isoform X1 [Tetranychus urticae]